MRATWWSDFYDWVGWIGYAGALHIEIDSGEISGGVDEYVNSEWVSREEIDSVHDPAVDSRDVRAKRSISKAI